jgi:hypothetical protein
MSWWNYKGNAENLFGTSAQQQRGAMNKSAKENVNRTKGLKNNGADKKCDFNDKLKLWNESLKRPKNTVSEFMVVFQVKCC